MAIVWRRHKGRELLEAGMGMQRQVCLRVHDYVDYYLYHLYRRSYHHTFWHLQGFYPGRDLCACR
jgi:hypothetical protein